MTRDPSSPPRAWQRMLSGRRLDLLNPDPKDVEIADIAHGLARVARWNGQTIGEHAFSVAQHVLVVEEIAHALQPHWTAEWRLAALLHDAPEYVIGDLISPFKTAIGLDYKAFEIRLLAAIHEKFKVAFPLSSDITHAIKHADTIAAYFEATVLAGFSESEAQQYFDEPQGLNDDIIARLKGLEPWSTSQAQAQFLERFQELHTLHSQS